MIDQIIHTLLDALRRAEIHSVFLTHVLDIFPRAREADEIGVEFGEIFFEDGGRVTRGVAGDEDGEELGGVLE